MSTIATFLAEFDNIPEADRRALSPEEQSKLLVILTHTVSDLSEELVELREENKQLRKLLGPSTAHFGKNLFAISSWKDLKTAADVREAQLFFSTHFASIASNPQCRATLSAITGLMNTAVLNQSCLETDAFVDSARTLVTELLVQKERANGWRDTALESLRSSLMGVSLPSEISAAYDHARLASKMTAPPPRAQQGAFRQRKQHRRDGPPATKQH